MSTTLPRSELAPGLWGWHHTSESASSTLLLIHGVGLRGEAWLPLLPYLKPTFSILAIDLPGHGLSPTLSGSEAHGLSDFTDRIGQILKGIDRPMHVIGHSMGAMIAIDLAARFTGQIASVTALNAIFRRPPEAALAVQQRADALQNEPNADPGPTLERWFGAEPEPTLDDMATACRHWLMDVDRQGYQTAYRVFAHSDGPSDEQLAHLACPALFMTGSEEPNSTPAMSKAMAELAPQGEYAEIAHARHMMPMTHAREVAARVDTFLTNKPD